MCSNSMFQTTTVPSNYSHMAPKVTLVPSLSFIFLLLVLLPLLSHADHEVHHPKKKTPPPQRAILLKDLQGARKGVKLQGLHQLKKYLHKFGYLTLSPTANDDDFDNALEAALKKYQQNFHLKATGSLDAETISMMTMPRCGVPDIINGTTRMQTGNKSHYHNPNSFTNVSLYSLRGSKWPTMPVTYRFVTSMDSSVQNVIKRAMSTWVAATNNQLSFQEVDSNELISIGFFSGDHGDGVPFDGPMPASGENILAHGFYPDAGGDLHFDATENWSTADPTPTGFIDVESVALHELGHTLGLLHSDVQGAIMWPNYSGGKALSSDDIDGIRALYGS